MFKEKMSVHEVIIKSLLLIIIFVLYGCANPNIGKVMTPAHDLNGSGKEMIKMGEITLAVNYKTIGNQITFEGFSVCSDKTVLGNWDGAVFTLTLGFLDYSNTLVDEKKVYLRGRGEFCEARHFSVTLPYKQEYKRMTYYLLADLEAW